MSARRSRTVKTDFCPGYWMRIVICNDVAHKALEEEDGRQPFPGFSRWRSFGNLAHHFILICATEIDEGSTKQIMGCLLESLQPHPIGLVVFGHIFVAIAQAYTFI